MARRQSGAHRLAQIRHVVVDLEIGVAGDAELREGLDFAAREQLAEMGADHAGQQHEGLPARCELVGHLDDARQHARHLDDRDRVLAAERVVPGQACNEVQRLVGYLRKRVRRVEPHRDEQRADLLLEELIDPAPLRLVAHRVVEDHDAGALQ